MKLKGTIVLCLFILINSIRVFAQSPKIESEGYTLLTKFMQITGSKEYPGNKEFMALAKHKDKYVLVFESVNTANNASGSLILDEYVKSVKLFVKEPKEIEGRKVYLTDNVILTPCENQPKTNTKGSLMAFDLPNEVAFDFKQRIVTNLCFYIDYHNGQGNEFKKEIRIRFSETKNFFKTNKLLLNSSKVGSFVSIAKYKMKPIEIYSLIRKKKKQIDEIIGDHTSIEMNDNSRYSSDITFIYTISSGEYKITYKKNTAYKIVFIPTVKFNGSAKFYVDQMFAEDCPFNLSQTHLGTYKIKKLKDTWDEKTITYAKEYLYPNSICHRVEITSEGRFIKEVIAFIKEDSTFF